MRDKIDERDLQDLLSKSVIKSYNVHYMTMDEVAGQDETAPEEAPAQEVKEEKKIPKVALEGYPEYSEELPPSAFYGKVEADDETLARMAEIMKDREAAVKDIFNN
ncbi:MAG: hypothetical protein K6F37_06485 [Lachnospiraceae bacterium]|nr:hypothetical protein [Lachnospiraceae bacterium]